MTPQTMPADADVPTGRRAERIRTIAYWTFTIFVVWEGAAGSLWDLFQIEYARVIAAHLGYPHYLGFIIGPWKLAGAVALLAPRFPRLKEWAYAGFFFNYYLGCASSLAVGDSADKWIPALVFAALTLGSWALRPTNRRWRHVQSSAEEGSHPRTWAIRLALLLVMLVVSYFTMPEGPPPGY